MRTSRSKHIHHFKTFWNDQRLLLIQNLIIMRIMTITVPNGTATHCTLEKDHHNHTKNGRDEIVGPNAVMLNTL